MLVRVCNLNEYPYREKFRERDIEIAAHGQIEMDYDEADAFLQRYTFPVKDHQGVPDPRYFKKLQIHPDDMKAIREKAAASSNLVCHANGQKAISQEELAKILGNFSHMLADRDETAEAEVIKKQNSALKKENKELKSRLELIEEKLGLRAEVHAEGL